MVLNLDSRAGQYALGGFAHRPALAFLSRPFPKRARCRVALYFEPKSISFTQVYPFLYYADAFRRRYGAEIRCFSNAGLMAGQAPRADHADVVLFQTWYDLADADLTRCVALLRKAHPDARLSFVDSFAHGDLRLARLFETEIKFYLKKSLFRDKELFFRPFRGDTNLTEYLCDLYGIEAEPVDWQVPRAILPKLRLSPNFFTAPRFLDAFAKGQVPSFEDRPLDVQTRFGIKGLDWYQAMRQDALDRVRAIDGLVLSPADRVSYSEYMKEMRRSKLCFSPNGYGELCWRDVEGVLAGAVLIKPDMSHLDSLPDIYEPEVTYLPVKWDFSDLEAVIRRALGDQALCARLAENAYRRIADYVRETRFVTDMGFLFDA